MLIASVKFLSAGAVVRSRILPAVVSVVIRDSTLPSAPPPLPRTVKDTPELRAETTRVSFVSTYNFSTSSTSKGFR